MPYLDEAVVSLRRARLAGTPFPGETDYVLGKAYFNKGKYYYDLAISSMESSVARGYVQKDSLRVHRAGVQPARRLPEGAWTTSSRRCSDDPSDLLLLTIGQTYYQMKRTGDAVDYLLRTLNKTEDKDIEEQARFLLGGDLPGHGRAVQGGGAVRRDREDRPAVRRRAFLPRGGVREDERPGEGARGVAHRAHHRPVALRGEAPLLRRPEIERKDPEWPGTGCSKRFPPTSG